MVKVINPMCSVSAHGKFAGLIFQTGRWGQIVKGHGLQRKKPTRLQYNQNWFFGVAADSWRILDDEEKKEWNRKASGKKMSGFNLYVKENIRHPGEGLYGQAKYGSGEYS